MLFRNDVLVFKETWTTSEINCSEQQIFNCVYRNDKSSKTSIFSRRSHVLKENYLRKLRAHSNERIYREYVTLSELFL